MVFHSKAGHLLAPTGLKLNDEMFIISRACLMKKCRFEKVSLSFTDLIGCGKREKVFETNWFPEPLVRGRSHIMSAVEGKVWCQMGGGLDQTVSLPHLKASGLVELTRVGPDFDNQIWKRTIEDWNWKSFVYQINPTWVDGATPRI